MAYVPPEGRPLNPLLAAGCCAAWDTGGMGWLPSRLGCNCLDTLAAAAAAALPRLPLAAECGAGPKLSKLARSWLLGAKLPAAAAAAGDVSWRSDSRRRVSCATRCSAPASAASRLPTSRSLPASSSSLQIG